MCRIRHTGDRHGNVCACYQSTSHKYLTPSNQVKKGLLESVGNVYCGVREKQGINVYRERVLQTVSAWCFTRAPDPLKIANIRLPNKKIRLLLWI